MAKENASPGGSFESRYSRENQRGWRFLLPFTLALVQVPERGLGVLSFCFDFCFTFLTGSAKAGKEITMNVMEKPRKSRKEVYSAYIESAHWQQLRQRKLASVPDQCECCERHKPFYHCHHINYRELYDVELEDLVVLCEECHNDYHRATRWYSRGMKPKSRDETIAFIKKFQAGEGIPEEELIRMKERRRLKFQSKRARKQKHNALKRKMKAAIGDGMAWGYSVKAAKKIIAGLQDVLREFDNEQLSA